MWNFIIVGAIICAVIGWLLSLDSGDDWFGLIIGAIVGGILGAVVYGAIEAIGWLIALQNFIIWGIILGIIVGIILFFVDEEMLLDVCGYVCAIVFPIIGGMLGAIPYFVSAGNYIACGLAGGIVIGLIISLIKNEYDILDILISYTVPGAIIGALFGTIPHIIQWLLSINVYIIIGIILAVVAGLTVAYLYYKKSAKNKFVLSYSSKVEAILKQTEELLQSERGFSKELSEARKNLIHAQTMLQTKNAFHEMKEDVLHYMSNAQNIIYSVNKEVDNRNKKEKNEINKMKTRAKLYEKRINSIKEVFGGETPEEVRDAKRKLSTVKDVMETENDFSTIKLKVSPLLNEIEIIISRTDEEAENKVMEKLKKEGWDTSNILKESR